MEPAVVVQLHGDPAPGPDASSIPVIGCLAYPLRAAGQAASSAAPRPLTILDAEPCGAGLRLAGACDGPAAVHAQRGEGVQRAGHADLAEQVVVGRLRP